MTRLRRIYAPWGWFPLWLAASSAFARNDLSLDGFLRVQAEILALYPDAMTPFPEQE